MFHNDLIDAYHGYIECALWSTHWTGEDGDDYGSFRDNNFDVDDLAVELAAEMLRDVANFVADNLDDCHEHLRLMGEESWTQIGHDFWLTREGHGAGFWDRGTGRIGDRLSEAARAYDGFYLDVAFGKVVGE